MLKTKILIFLLLTTLSLPSRADLSHRAGVQLGGMYIIMGYGDSAGALYQLAFHRNLALEINGNYNFGAVALGQGPHHSGGLDVSLQAMLYNFGNTDFSKGFGLGLGGGAHYLADFNQNFEPRKRTFVAFPIGVELFYQHLFDNNWFIKTGFKGYVVQFARQLEGQKSDAAKILPFVYFDLGYSF